MSLVTLSLLPPLGDYLETQNTRSELPDKQDFKFSITMKIVALNLLSFSVVQNVFAKLFVLYLVFSPQPKI